MFRIIETTILKRLFLLYLIPLETTVLKLLFILYLRPLETTVLKRLDGNFSKEFPHEALALNSLYCFPTIAITSLPFYSPLSLSPHLKLFYLCYPFPLVCSSLLLVLNTFSLALMCIALIAVFNHLASMSPMFRRSNSFFLFS